jgi:hypothetical protein
MIEPMTPETLQRLMAQHSPEAAEQELACEIYTRAVLVARSLVAAYGPDGAERFARQLSRHLARQLELARADDVSGSAFSIR